MKSGDFVWPKKPGSYVPYSLRNRSPSTPFEDDTQWEAGKADFLKEAKSKAPYFSDTDIEEIRNITFAQFYVRYVGTPLSNEPSVMSFGVSLFVGHVGIVDVDSGGKRWIIEAILDSGVVRTPYADWLSSRNGELVWSGRLKGTNDSDRQRISLEAGKYIGRPYDFWNFDLSDDRAFYCSKLVWLAVVRSLAIAIDGNSNPKRVFWLSPKQVLYAPTIDRMNDPGPYAPR